jgi:spore coat protein U-like protein
MRIRTTQSCSRFSRHRSARAALATLALFMCFDAQALDCTVSATGVAFGVYDAASTVPTDSAGNVSVRCTHLGGGAVKTNYSITLSTGSSGAYAQRRMRAGTSFLNYNLFTDAARLQVWGNGTAGSTLVAGSLLVNPGNFVINEMSHPIYGRIPAQQAADTGSYSDTILVTLTF